MQNEIALLETLVRLQILNLQITLYNTLLSIETERKDLLK